MGYKDKEKQKEYQRNWVARRRADYLLDRSCIVCGATDRLEVDHIDPTQKVSHRVWSWSKKRMDEELEKCQILCQVHHLEKTNKWKFENRSHGHTLYGHGCRCGICFNAQRAHNARRYK